jgi:peptide/nickel transport system substrate-binding protein
MYFCNRAAMIHQGAVMIHKLAICLILSALAPGFSSEAATFRYAYRVDPVSLDPYSTAETFTTSWLGQIYEPLVSRGKNLELEPALAVKWEQPDPLTWRFFLRPNVRFQNGEAFTADDVVFSLQRAASEGSDLAYTINSVKEFKKIDDLTVDLILKRPNAILPYEINFTFIMSKSWTTENNAIKPASVRANIENYASTHTNGTGPFKLKSRQAGVKTVLEPSSYWWGKREDNLTEVIFTPIQSDATRVAALLSGEVDMIYPVPQQDVDRIKGSGRLSILQENELRTVFLNFDQKRDELLESNVKGKNPFKDKRVRQAIYQAIDIDAIRDRIMGGTSHNAGIMVAPGVNGYDESLDRRLPFDPRESKRLLSEAGYPDGFEVGMDCPNDRYINDEKICQAVVGMLGRVGVKVKLLAQTRAKYFEKVLSRNTCLALLGWQPLSYDALSTLRETTVTPAEKLGTWNVGSYSNPKIDELTSQIEVEANPARRQALISEALSLEQADIAHIPLHQAALAWGVRNGVHLVQRSDESLELKWVRVDN